jgi:hypothetical protein
MSSDGSMANWTTAELFTCCGLWQSQDMRTKNAQERLQVQIKAHDVRIFQLDKQINDLTGQKNKAIAARDIAAAKRAAQQKFMLCKKREKYVTARALCERACDSIGEVESVKETVTVLSEVRSTFKNQKMEKLFSELGTVTDAFSDVQLDLRQSQSMLTMNAETGAPWASDAELLKELEEIDALVDFNHASSRAPTQAAVQAHADALGGAAHRSSESDAASPLLKPPPTADMDAANSMALDPVTAAYRAAGVPI